MVATAHRGVAFGGTAAVLLAAIAGGRLAADSQQLVFVVAAATGAVALTMALGLRGFVCVFLAYLPFEGLVLAQLPESAVAGARYAPEALLWLLALGILCTRGLRSLHGLKPVLAPLLAIAAVAVLSAATSQIPIDRMLIGLRSELRFLPLILIAAVAFRGAESATVVARVIVWTGVAQGALGFLGLVLGEGFKTAISPQFSVTVGGVEVAPTALLREGTIAGSLNNYNHFATVLAVSALVGLVVGAQRLGVHRFVWIAVIGFLCGMVVLSGSREGVLALGLGLTVLAWRAGYRWVVLGLSIGAVLVGLALPNYDTIGNVDSRGLSARWSAILDPRTFSTDQQANFRLALLETELAIAARHNLLLGTGPGSVVDRRTEADGSNPLYETHTGKTALRFNFTYDGNWGLIALEFGLLGLAGFAWFLLRIWRLGRNRGPAAWASSCLVTLVPVVVLLGFFSAILQQRQMASVLFVLVGIAATEGVARTR